MLGKSALLGAFSPSYDKRIFVCEIEGLRQTGQVGNKNYPLRNSGRILLQIPYSCMNEEMQRIKRLGGTIVSIRSLGDDSSEE
ncbi:MAG: phycobilisome linker polypeptide [Leptolyngbyaceae cyanobacterium MO_188.B28]|nr:phycobilisome linker polypeptide [Leptolyngbyaceae cyanobacterium MO_188.B28]